MSASAQLHLLLIGCGKVAARHAAALRRIDPSLKLSFASRELAKAQDYVQRFSGSLAFGSYDEALSSRDIDAALVLVPPHDHLTLTLRALETGKHVLVEKPPFARACDFDAVIAASRSENRQVMVAENYYYKPLLIALRKLLAERVIGDVLFVHINAIKQQRTTDWRDDPTLAIGGALYEGGIHWVNFVSNLGLTLTSVIGFRPALVVGNSMERSMMLGLSFAEGAVGSLFYSWEVPSLFGGLRLSKIYGRDGSITFETNGLWIWVRGKRWSLQLPGLRDITGGQEMLRDFLAAVRHNTPPAFTIMQAKRDLEFVEDAYSSANQRPTRMVV